MMNEGLVDAHLFLVHASNITLISFMIPEHQNTFGNDGNPQDLCYRLHMASDPIALDPACVLANLGGEAVLLTPSMEYLKLDSLGEYIVECLLVKKQLDEIVELIVRDYSVDVHIVRKDVEEFLAHLGRFNILS